ncbi:ABC transporter permease [Halalkalibacillus halophilus]|uniref:ABC transporter permease n=1 Tax=Halalkalibacillus halophilus TaxID=392827 RepID=UPI00042236B7|nr:ABC transporter permease subunit [Halalkalibacillus halophilus]
MQWLVIFNKELLEHLRNFKWIWVPIVFILFAVMDPITTYYLPIILESVGGMPEGASIDIPSPPPAEAMMMSFNQLSVLGVLIAVVISMGMVSSELKSGVYELILSKPVSYIHYITAKYAAMSVLVSISLVISLIAGWYYVTLLFGDIAFSQLLVSAIFYVIWFLLVLSIVMMFNTMFRSQGLVAFISIIVILAINIITSIYSHVLTWSPALISDYIGIYLFSGNMETEMWMSVLISVILMVVALTIAITTLKNRAIE